MRLVGIHEMEISVVPTDERSFSLSSEKTVHTTRDHIYTVTRVTPSSAGKDLVRPAMAARATNGGHPALAAKAADKCCGHMTLPPAATRLTHDQQEEGLIVRVILLDALERFHRDGADGGVGEQHGLEDHHDRVDSILLDVRRDARAAHEQVNKGHLEREAGGRRYKRSAKRRVNLPHAGSHGRCNTPVDEVICGVGAR